METAACFGEGRVERRSTALLVSNHPEARAATEREKIPLFLTGFSGTNLEAAMASNSSAAAVAAMFGIRDADHQDQMKPLLAQQHQHQHQMPPAPLLNAASSSAGPGQAAGATPPAVKKKRNLPGN